MSNIYILCLFVAAAGLSWLLTGWLARFLAAQGIVDTPGKTSLHEKSLPTGAGLGLLMVVLPGWLLIAHEYIRPEFFTVLAACVVLTIVSWLDDRKHIPILPRLITHIVAVSLGLAAFSKSQLLFQGILPFWADRILMGLLWLWFLNLYNFMDGMDGLTGFETLSLTAGVLLLCMLFPAMQTLEYAAYALVLAGAIAGFLIWNCPPARVFLGDVGSITVGFLLGWLLLEVALQGFRAAVLILPGYYWGDATLTLLKRIIRREKFWEGHKQSWFHRALARGTKPEHLLLRVLGFNIVLIALAIIAAMGGTTPIKIKLVTLAALLTLVFLRTLDLSGKKPG